MEQLSSVKQTLHVSAAPSAIVCRDKEQNRVLEFLKRCVEEEKGGSLYVCGCPGTGKSLSMEKVKEALVAWAKEVKLSVLNPFFNESLPLDCCCVSRV